MTNISNRSCRENQKTHFILNNFYVIKNRAVYEIIWKNILELERQQVTIWRMGISRWVTEATNTHSRKM
jgi:hypothetical protein